MRDRPTNVVVSPEVGRYLDSLEAREYAAKGRERVYREALERIADATEMTGDGVLEEMIGPAKRELDARMRLARNALVKAKPKDA